MSYQFVCPGCRNIFSLPANTPGAVVTCPHCATQMQLPGVALPVAQPVLVAQTPPLNSLKTDDLAPGFLRGKAKETPGAGCVASIITTFVLAVVIVAIIFGIVHVDRQNELANVPQEKPLPVAGANAGPGDPAPKQRWGNLRRQNNGHQLEEPDAQPIPPSDHGLSGGEMMALALIVVVGCVIYWLPTIMALDRRHHDTAAIAVLNFFLGWTFIGWIVALVWSCTAVRSREHVRDQKLSA